MSVTNKNQSKVWTLFHEGGTPTSSGSDYLGQNVVFFQQLVTKLQGGRMLDIGTGNMPVPRLISELGVANLEIHAIDVANIKPQFICEGVAFRQESSEKTSFADGFFDLVTGSYALEYSNIENSLKEICRVLKPGGRGGFIMHHPHSVVVKRMQLAHDNDISLPVKLDALKVLEKFVEKPTGKNRRSLEALVARLESMGKMNQYSMFRGVLDAMQMILKGYKQGEPVSPDAFNSWLKDALQKIKGTEYRHRLMEAAIVHDEIAITTVLEGLKARILRFEPIESEVNLGAGPGGEIQQGIIGWALVFERAE